jgi:hypothetical protein
VRNSPSVRTEVHGRTISGLSTPEQHSRRLPPSFPMKICRNPASFFSFVPTSLMTTDFSGPNLPYAAYGASTLWTPEEFRCSVESASHCGESTCCWGPRWLDGVRTLHNNTRNPMKERIASTIAQIASRIFLENVSRHNRCTYPCVQYLGGLQLRESVDMSVHPVFETYSRFRRARCNKRQGNRRPGQFGVRLSVNISDPSAPRHGHTTEDRR